MTLFPEKVLESSHTPRVCPLTQTRVLLADLESSKEYSPVSHGLCGLRKDPLRGSPTSGRNGLTAGFPGAANPAGHTGNQRAPCSNSPSQGVWGRTGRGTLWRRKNRRGLMHLFLPETGTHSRPAVSLLHRTELVAWGPPGAHVQVGAIITYRQTLDGNNQQINVEQ